jgi:hypothetical protein
MRMLSIALVAAVLVVPSVGNAQDQGLVDGKVGPDSGSALSSSSTAAQPRASGGEEGYGSRPRAPQEHPGFAGAVAGGQVIDRNTPITQQWGGMGVAVVNGHRVQVDVNSGRIMRVLN